MRKILGTMLVAALFAAGAAQAQAPAPPPAPVKESGFTMALRVGYALPMGDFVSGGGMDQFLGGAVPLWVDLGYRINRSMFVGAYFQYAFGSTAGVYKDTCAAVGADCTPSITRIGAEFLYRFSPDASFIPWGGIGLGYETVTFNESFAGMSGSSSASGFEFLNLQLGGDFKVSPSFALGPYVALSIASYTSIEGVVGFSSSTHEWLQLGLKGTFDF